MFKKVSVLVICLIMVFSFAGCSKDYIASSDYLDITSKEPDTGTPIVNPLTGTKNIKESKIDRRPVAVMINNISIAQPVQTGLNAADIIYETEVEGGITRLMAIYKDLSAVGQIGSVRSARYPYVDIALGHDAIYLHCGQDPKYCKPHLKDIDDISVDTATPGARRIKNGLASEHTLFIFGNEIWKTVASKFKTKSKATAWQNFASEDETVTLTGGAADDVEIPFPDLKTVFKYDSSTGVYTRYSQGNVRKDAVTGEDVTVKNIFILMTSITTYPDGKHRRVALDGGTGYYITNGTYTPIKWEKGEATAPFKFTNEDGSELKVSAGRSWVCLPNTATCTPVMKAAENKDTTSNN